MQTSKRLIHGTGPESKESQDRQRVIRQDTAVPSSGILRLTHSLDIGKECSHPKSRLVQHSLMKSSLTCILSLFFSLHSHMQISMNKIGIVGGCEDRLNEYWMKYDVHAIITSTHGGTVMLWMLDIGSIYPTHAVLSICFQLYNCFERNIKFCC